MGSDEASRRNRDKELTIITDLITDYEDSILLDKLYTKLIYISGPISGIPDYNKQPFELAKNILVDAGFKVVSPLDCIPEKANPLYVDHIKADIIGMLQCEAIAFLPGWLDSPGSKTELTIAKSLNMQCYLLLPHQRVLISMERV